jgi:DNA-binding transcriptional LysR family regulator
MSQVPSLRDIEMFNLVATELSFRRAAERMAIDQSALSRRIRQLEEQLGFQLIRRTTAKCRSPRRARSSMKRPG